MDRQDWYSLADEYGPAVGLVVVVAFMVWIRTLGRDDVFVDGQVYFTSGNDPWYHARIVQLIVEHFPATQRFDAWSYFPYGTGRHSGFGGLFDQLIALGAVVVGGGSPSPGTTDTVIAYAPVAFGALTAVPAYFVGKWATDKWGGLLTAVILSLLGGGFLRRTVIGVADHQSSEAFFGTLAFAGLIYAVQTGYAEKPTVADIRDRNWIVLRRPLVASFLGGVAIASYLMTWGPGVAFVFTMGVFVLLQLIRDYLNDRPTEYLAITTAATMLPATVLTLGYAKEYGLSATSFSLLQPLVVGGIGAGAILMYWIATYVDREGYERRAYPAVVVGLIAAILLVSVVVYPRTIDLFESLFVRMYSYGTATSTEAGTVGEITPADLDSAWLSFGPTFYLAGFGFVALLSRVLGQNRPIELLLVLWSFSSVSAYFTMTRFGYYLAVNVALLSAFAIWWTATGPLELGEIEVLSDVETYQILGVALLLILVLPGNVVALDNNSPNWESAEFLSNSNTAWQEELEWMQENTPEVPLDYGKLTERPENDDFDYPDGTYGVMSWWDYGHWITRAGERIPNANPFQEGPRAASAYLLSESEERANLVLESLPSMQDSADELDRMSSDELRSVIANQSDQEAGEDTRYVMIDDQMAAIQGPDRRTSGKFNPITAWIDTPGGVYTATRNRTIRAENETTQVPLVGTSERYENTMLSRLYYGDTEGLSHYRLVHETASTTTFASLAQETSDGQYQATGIVNAMALRNGRVLSRGMQRALRDPSIVPYDTRTQSRVKTFERVEGAEITGQVDPARLNGTNATVLARVRLNTETRNRNFTYRTQTSTDANGEFSVTVPYPTDNSVSPEEGGTDAGVTAVGNYSVLVNPIQGTVGGRQQIFGALASASTEVPEQAIYNGSSVAVEFDPGYEPGTLNATLDESTIENGSTTNLTVTGDFTNGTTQSLTGAAAFASNDTDVATIDANGTITANGTGVARIDASYAGDTATAVLTVENASANGSVASLDPYPLAGGDAIVAEVQSPDTTPRAPERDWDGARPGTT